MGTSFKLIGLPQAALKAYGSFVGRYPLPIFLVSFLVYAGLCLGWLRVGPEGRDAWTDLTFEELWTVKGSELESQIKYVLKEWKFKNKADWYQDYHYTMVTGQGDRKGADMLTREMMLESFRLYAKFFDIKVTTRSGKKYGTWDLCARGAVPDNPNNTVMMPCKIVDPLNCFSEYTAVLDPQYIKEVDGSGADGIASYQSRPSLKNSSDAEIKATVSGGCKWFVDVANWEVKMWSAGSREWSGNVLKRAEALSWTLFVDGPKRIALRMSLTKPELADVSEIREALALHAKVWTDTVVAFTKESPILEAANIETDFLAKLEKELEVPEWGLIIAGSVLMVLFVALAMGSWTSPLASRCNLGQQGLTCVMFSTLAAGGFWFLFGFKLNAAIMTGIPFLAMGLGVNDMLVLSRSFSELGVPYIKDHSNSEVLEKVLASAGVGVSLTSFCNITAFSLASLVPVHGLADFCTAAAIDSTTNYFAMMTLFLCCICLEAHRVRTERADPAACTWPCHAWLYRSGKDSCGPDSLVEEKLVSFFAQKLAPCLASRLAGCIILLLTCLMIGLSVYPIMNKELGYNPEECAPVYKPSYRALELLFDEFNFFEARLVFADLDVPANQAEMLKLYSQVTNNSAMKFTMPYPVIPYLTMFYSHVEGLPNNATLFENRALANSPTGKLYAPQGTVVQKDFYSIYKSWSAMPLDDPAKALAPGGDTYTWADLTFTNEFSYHPDGRIKTSFAMFFLVDATGDKDFLTCIQETEKIVNSSPLDGKAFVYADIFTFWSTFLVIDVVLWRALGIILAVMIVSSFLVLQSPLTALIVAGMSMMITLNTLAIALMVNKFNSFVVSCVLTGAGLSIEFTAHISSSFVLSRGTPEQRLAKVMKETYPAVIQGAVSTLLGILPLAMSRIPFARQYIWLPFTILVLVGTFNGLVLLPGLLGLLAHFQGPTPLEKEGVESAPDKAPLPETTIRV